MSGASSLQRLSSARRIGPAGSAAPSATGDKAGKQIQVIGFDEADATLQAIRDGIATVATHDPAADRTQPVAVVQGFGLLEDVVPKGRPFVQAVVDTAQAKAGDLVLMLAGLIWIL